MKESKKSAFDGKKVVDDLTGFTNKVSEAASEIANKSKDLAVKSQASVVSAIDQNGDGKIDIEDIIIIGLKTPGIRINRSDFLRKELFKNYPQEVIEDAIANTPAHAQIPAKDIDKIADAVIKYERNCVSGISAALSVTGGVTMIATIPADIAQYYGYMLRVTQKLLYLYGFPEIDTEEKGQKFDSETMNILIICLGAMYGVAGANQALRIMAKAFAAGASKKFMKTAVTKGVLYPILRDILKWFNVNLVKKMVANSIDNFVPVIGSVLGGALTFVTFKPCCDRLKASLQDTLLSNPNRAKSDDEDDIIIDMQEV